MSKYQKQVRIRPVVTGLFSKPRYHFECRDWYGVVGVGPSIPSAWADYVAESLGEAHDRLFNDVLFADPAVDELLNAIRTKCSNYLQTFMQTPTKLFMNDELLTYLKAKTDLINHNRLFGVEIIVDKHVKYFEVA